MVDLAQATCGVGIEPIPPSARRLGFLDTFVLWANLGVSFLVMVVGMFLVPGLGLGQALVAILVGGSYWYLGGVNWPAMAVWLLGFLLYLLISGLPQLGLLGWAPWLGATLPSFLFGVIVYALVSRSVVKQVQD